MLKNYFKTAFRNVMKHKSNSIINVVGLMVGFSAFLLIFLVIQYEKSFDDFHANAKNIYRVVRIGKDPINPEYRTGVPIPVTTGLRNELPVLKNTAAIFGDNNIQVNIIGANGAVAKKFKEQKIFTAEPSFFQMFDFGLAEGSTTNALNQPNTALLTKDIAAKYFGDWKSAMGKTIKIYGENITITGVLNNPPANTDFPLSVVVSYATLLKNINLNDWGSIDDNNYCLVQLDDKTSIDKLNKLLVAFVDKHIKPVNPGYSLALQPLQQIHYDERYGNFNGHTFSKDLIFALSLIGLFLLIIACVNFINLTTAQAAIRAREVGVRKVLGGSRIQLVLQFLSETGITTLLALVGAVCIVCLCIPFLNNLMEIHLSAAVMYGGKLLLFLLGTLLLVTFLSGLYPAMVLSGFAPIRVLKNRCKRY